MLTFRFSKADGRMEETETLTSGMEGKEVKLEFSEEWEGFSKTVVFTAGCESRDVVDPGDVAVIPHEVLAESRNDLYVGVYGVAADGRVIPSIRVRGPHIHPGVDPSGDETTAPTPSAWDQVQQEMARIREEVAELREDTPSGAGLSMADDGEGNLQFRSEGGTGIADDGAGNIAITMGGA